MDISSLRERRAPSELTVSELNAYIKRIFESDRTLSLISVRGEISNLTLHRSGHIYFSLKDEASQIKAVMFRSAAASLKFTPENGMKVILRCSVSVYEAGGLYQLYVNSILPDGIGALYLAYEQLKKRLDEEGLFSYEHKIPLPRFPQRIGIITSPSGAAVRDIINVTHRRFPLAKIYIYPALVQGDGAVADLVAGLEYFEESKLADVIIIGRGGGSIEDLWAFNSERLARRIYDCEIPIISAVGHETDFTICDFVADMRAPTPSAAAEIAVPDVKELLQWLDNEYDKASKSLKRIAERKEEKLSAIKKSVVFTDADSLFTKRYDKLKHIRESAADAVTKRIFEKDRDISVVASKAHALSPLATLARGYSVVTVRKKCVASAMDVNSGDEIKVRLNDGEIYAEVKNKVVFKNE